MGRNAPSAADLDARAAASAALPTPETAVVSSRTRLKLSAEDAKFFAAMRTRATSEAFGSPYITSALFNLTPVNTPGLGTFAVDDKYRVYLDMQWAKDKGVEYVTGVLVHEAWHALRGHGARFKEASSGDKSTHGDWNRAADAEINDDIKGIVPDDGVFPGDLEDENGTPMIEGKTAEQYYAALRRAREKKKEEQKQKQQGDGQDGEGESDGSGQQQGQGQGSGKGRGQGQPGQGSPGSSGGGGGGDQEDQDGSGGGGYHDHDDDDEYDDGRCGGGSGVTGTPGDWELDSDEAPMKTEVQQEVIAQQVAEAIQKQAARAQAGGKHAGRTPSDSELEWAKQKLATKPVDWRTQLRSSVRNALESSKGPTDYTYKRRSRRQSVTNAILPGMHTPKPKVAVAIDTSGSMGPEDLALAVNEVLSIGKNAGYKDGIRTFSVDSRVGSKPFLVKKASDVKLTGGGGTDMGVAIAEFENMPKRDRPNVGVVITDGVTPWPKEPPQGMKIVVCIVGDQYENYESSYPAPEWAKVVRVKVEKD